MIAADLLISMQSVNNSGEMLLIIQDQIDETIKFMEQSILRLRA